jgi:quinol monooxygenase YgiN
MTHSFLKTSRPKFRNRFKDKASAEAHRTTEHFKKFMEEVEKDKVDVEGPAELRAMTPLGGFTPLG